MQKTIFKIVALVGFVISFNVLSQDDDPKARLEAEMRLIRDPATGTVPLDRLVSAREEISARFREKGQNIAIAGINWSERGPNNIGGRTRALMFDPNDATKKKVWAGSVGGGVWYNNDITSAASVWNKVNDFWANLAISCIAYDPLNTQNFYVGTGEGWYNSDSQQGAGIWNSSDGGTTWAQLPATASNADFKYVQKIVVNPSGVIFAATQGGVYKSVNGGTTWTINLTPSTIVAAPNTNFASDLEIGSDGVIYAAFGRVFDQGSRIFKTADAGLNWTQVTADATQYRTEIALAPSTSGASQAIYAIAQSSAYTTAWVKKSTNGGVSWVDINPPSSLTGNQAWYDMILAVHPTNPSIVIGAGNVVGRTTNGSTWTVRAYGGEGLHPDHHSIIFRPGFPNETIHGCDGGVYYSPDYGNIATVTPTFSARNSGFNVTQYYGVAMKNIAGDGYLLAGAQDNGTHKITSVLNTIGSASSAYGADGMLGFIDQDQPTIQILSYQGGVYFLYNETTNAATSLGISGGEFVGPSDYSSTQNVLYTEKSPTTMNMVAGIGGTRTVTTITHTSAGSTSLIRAGLTNNTVFVGGYGGLLHKITNAGNMGGTQALATISPAGTFGGAVSCVEIGATESELLVTISNYGVKSVYYTTNGGTTWISKDEVGYGLPDLPIRFALFNPNNRKQVLLATELGVFSTNDITAANPGWEPTNATLANVSCYMLRNRAADGVVAVATHGRGIYTMKWCIPPGSPTAVTVSTKGICLGTPVTLSANFDAGTTLKWFNQSSGGTLIGTGNNLQYTPPAIGNFTYYASSENGLNCAGIRTASPLVTVGTLLSATWLGFTNNWNEPTNWSGGFVPNDCTDVIINAPVSFMPLVSGLNNFCNDIHINAGAVINFSSGAKLQLK